MKRAAQASAKPIRAHLASFKQSLGDANSEITDLFDRYEPRLSGYDKTVLTLVRRYVREAALSFLKAATEYEYALDAVEDLRCTGTYGVAGHLSAYERQLASGQHSLDNAKSHAQAL
jgi:hypothetical protein